jgi:hypothetical protein
VQEIALWDPNSAPNVTEDPFKTLFIARVNYYTSESKLRFEIPYINVKHTTPIKPECIPCPDGLGSIFFGKCDRLKSLLCSCEINHSVSNFYPKLSAGSAF